MESPTLAPTPDGAARQDSALPRAGWVNRLAASPRFHALCARVPGLRAIARAEGAALFDEMAGFVRSAVLGALVELRVLHLLGEGPATVAALAQACGVPEARMAVLAQAGAATGLLKRQRDGRFALSRRGAAFLGVPGLEALVRHHAVLYRDLGDPAAFFRGRTDPELAHFWPYVFGAGAASDPGTAATYSRLMADTQALVAADTLDALPWLGARAHLMDVGGGTGAFLRAVHARYPALRLTLFDLPAVVAAAPLPAAIARAPGSFRDDPLPRGADTISLVRVLYDHSDDTVRRLLAGVARALPAQGGRLIVSEPMSGGDRPDPQTDTYFAVYTLAMGTGRTRSAAQIAALLTEAGFEGIETPAPRRRFVTQIVTAHRAAVASA